MRVRKVLCFFLFLFLVEDAETTYAQYFPTPFAWASDFFYMKLPHRIRPMDHIVAVCLYLALKSSDGKGPRVTPMRNTLLLSATTIFLWFVYGVILRGGDGRMASFQVYALMSGVLFSFAIAAAFRRPEHFVMLAKVVVAAGVYRAIMCWLFYFMVVRPMTIPMPEYLTSHDDTVVWVVSVFVLLTRFFKPQPTGKLLRTLFLLALFFGAIQFNARRLAWVSLAMGSATLYFLLAHGRAKRRINRLLLVVGPIAVIYVAVGWGRTERMFKPLQAFASVSTTEDASTKSRNVENLGLIFTAQSNGWLTGSGWGHKYMLVSNKYDIGQYFPLWRYIPHNSILGILAFTGAFGFCGYWMTFPTAMFLNARMAKKSKVPLVTNVAIVGAVQMVVCVNQFFGDMGLFSYKVVYVMATSYAIALRLPIASGVWPAGKTVPAAKPAVGTNVAPEHAQARERTREDAWES